MLTFEIVEDKFKKVYPFGSLTKYSKNEYGVYFTSDTRTAAEKEVETNWNTVTDTRKLYTYKVRSLKELANKLNLNLVERSKLNAEFEAMRKIEVDENELFGD